MPAAIEWTPQLEQSFIDGILEGTSIAKIAESVGIGPASFYRHRIESEEFDRSITRAQEWATESQMDELVALADTANEETATAVKLKVWTRMWIAGRRKPKKYGDFTRNEVSGPDGGPIKTQQVQVEFVKPNPNN